LELLLSTFVQPRPEFQLYGSSGWLQLHHTVLSLIGRDLGMIWNVCSFIEANQSKFPHCSHDGPQSRGINFWKATFSSKIVALPKFSSVL
jgi:hypothetical protein